MISPYSTLSDSDLACSQLPRSSSLHPHPQYSPAEWDRIPVLFLQGGLGATFIWLNDYLSKLIPTQSNLSNCQLPEGFFGGWLACVFGCQGDRSRWAQSWFLFSTTRPWKIEPPLPVSTQCSRVPVSTMSPVYFNKITAITRCFP